MTYRIPQRLAHVVTGGLDDNAVVFLMTLPDDAPVVLHGSGALIWLTAVRGEENVPLQVAQSFGANPDEIRGAVHDYLVELVHRRLLERVVGLDHGPTES